jgi:hypothetical protein
LASHPFSIFPSQLPQFCRHANVQLPKLHVDGSVFGYVAQTWPQLPQFFESFRRSAHCALQQAAPPCPQHSPLDEHAEPDGLH